MDKPVVFLVCTGLGKINRGYESFTRECFDTLKDVELFNLYLIKGAGKQSKREKTVLNVHRNSKLAQYTGKLFRMNGYGIEQASFCIALLPFIIRKKPALIYYSDFALGSYLWHLRRYLKFKYRLLFCNGAPNGPPYKTEDHVQQLLPVYFDIGVKADNNITKHTLLPYAFNIDVDKHTALLATRETIRKQHGFLPDQKLILSIGAVNKRHKRFDYVINEIAQLPEDYFLIILGQYDDETDFIKRLAKEKLPGRHLIANLAQHELFAYYAAADLFVLASLREGFPRVTIEALSFGLPCIVHDYVVMKQVLKKEGIYCDMRFEGELYNCIKQTNVAGIDYRQKLIETAYNQYSWDILKNNYRQMIYEQI